MTLDKRQRMLLVGALAAVDLIVIILAVPLLSPRERTPDKATLVIPEADLREGDGTKVSGYRQGGARDEWDSLDEADRVGSAEPPLRERPEPATVEEVFGGGGAQQSRPSRRGGPGGGSPGGHAAAAPVLPAPEVEKAETAPTSATEEKPRSQVKRSGAVSSLEEDITEDLGNGFSTLDGTDRWVGAESGKPYRCMFTRDEKVRSGQRITVRLLEDLVTGSVHIPRNTHLQGVVSVSDRMEIKVGSIDMGGRIVSLRLEAYDTDGGKGIYCSDLSQTGKAVTEQGLSTLSSTLSSRLGRVARDAAAVGASIVRNKAGEATVSVPAGYTFYLIEKTQ